MPLRRTATVVAMGGGALVASLVLALELIGRLGHHQLPTPPLAASVALVASTPAAPAARPRNIVAGHLLGASIGAVIGTVVADVTVATACAAGAAALALSLTRTPQPPAIATACVAAAGRAAGIDVLDLLLLQLLPLGFSALAIQRVRNSSAASG
jgi:CBS-domain-containing membrane protein